MEYISGDSFNQETTTRIAHCGLCEKQTEQRIEEREIVHHKDSSTNPRFGKATFEDILCWWCNECDEWVVDIALGNY